MLQKIKGFFKTIPKIGRRSSILEYKNALITTIIAAIIFSVAGWGINTWLENRLLIEAQAKLTTEINLYGVSLTQAVNSQLALVGGVNTYLESELAHSDTLDEAELDTFAAGISENSHVIRNIAIAPDGIMQYVYPYEENKSVLGYEPAKDERASVRADVNRAIAKRVPILSLPIELIQGGQGIIARQAVYVNDTYWGLSNVVIDVPLLFNEAGILEETPSITLAIRDQSGSTFFGADEIFMLDPVTYTIPLPEGSWTLAGVPPDGWYASYKETLQIYRGLIFGIAALATAFGYFFTSRQERLTHLVEERTSELNQANAQLQLDILKRQNTEAELQENQQRLEKIFSQSPIPLVITDTNGDIEFYNDKFIEVFGYTLDTVSTAEEWWQACYPDPEYRQTVRTFWDMAIKDAQRTGQQIETQEWDMTCADGAVKRVEFDMMPMGDISVIAMNDITERKEYEDKLHHMATHDSLTNLPNRDLLNDLFTQACIIAHRDQKYLHALFLDLDNFKSVNDAYGHKHGDWLLQLVTHRLRETLRDADTIARFGGDEFVILLTFQEESDDILTVIQKIIDVTSKPFSIQGTETYITCSIGISVYPTDSENPYVLLQYADRAMYQAKKKGKNSFQFYSPEMETQMVERLKLRNELRQAIDQKEFLLYYQPQVDIETGKLVGVEALMRWDHPTHGLLRPNRFISQAEEIGLIVPIGEWALQAALQQLKEWIDQGLPPVQMAFNISGRELKHHDFLNTVTRSLEKTGIPPHLLELELSENIVFQNLESALVLLNDLKKLGVHIAVDDFGIGYSTLSQIGHFPLDTLKIDRHFASHVPQSTNDAAIVKGIVTIAQSLNLKIIAEGIETQEQLDFYQSLGCKQVQGYIFSKAIPASEIEILLRDGISL